MRTEYKARTHSIKPIVIDMVESLNSLKAHFETTSNTGTPLKDKSLDVKWMRNGLANFASISFNEKFPSILDEKSLGAFLRLLK